MELLFNREPICPHCGKALRDARELNLSDGESETVECGTCEKEFVVECHVGITYCTSLPSPPAGKEEG